MSRQEVKARLGDQECEVKTLDNTHLYCEPPENQPASADDSSPLPSLKVARWHVFSTGKFSKGTVLTMPVFLLPAYLSGVVGKPRGGSRTRPVWQWHTSDSFPIGCSDWFRSRGSCDHPVSACCHPHVQVSVRTFMCFMCIYSIVIECLNHLYLPICIL